MTLSKMWIKQMKNYCFKLAKINTHVLFLEACVHLGLSPLGLSPKPPLSGTPNYMWPSLINIYKTYSLESTKIILANYKNEQKILNTGLNSVTDLLLGNFPYLLEEMTNTVIKANKLQDQLAKTKLKKLSKLCLLKIKEQGYIDVHQQSPVNNIPLLGDKPNLASLLKLPIPTGQLPYLPKTPLQQKTTPPSSEDSKENNSATSQQSVMNISTHNLTTSEHSVLAKGLTFTPTHKLDPFCLGQDVFSFARNLRIQFHLYQFPDAFKNHTQPETCLLKFKPPSNWDPPPLPSDHPIELYINYIMQSITDPNFLKQLPNTDNLTVSEREALKSLKNNRDIMILPADKGSTTVVMDKSNYLEEAHKQLSDTTTYRLIDEDPTLKFNNDLTRWLKREAKQQMITPETQDLLINVSPSTPQFYLLPKIHKNTFPPPGRPIVASCNSPTERISAYVDSYLQPFVINLPSYVKDTNHFLDRLASIPMPLQADTILVTIDVTSLYTNIPHSHGLAAMEFFLDQRPNNSHPSTAFLVNLAKFILEKNNFQFEGKNYIQTKGTAMGTKMAPSFANLFMGRLEQAFLKSQLVQPECWFRYIDDIFVIWTKGLESLNQFLQNLNKFSILKFTNTTSTSEITFLDVCLRIEDGHLQTGIHVKPTNHLQYLHFNSSHPNNTKRSIPYSQAIRAKRICSTPDELNKFNTKMTDAFINRGYPKNLVANQIRLAQSDNQPSKQPSHSKKLSLITEYHNGLHSLNTILKDGFKILQASTHTKDFLQKPPTTVFKQAPNLKKILVHPKIPDPNIQNSIKQPAGSFPCDKIRCKTCEINRPSDSFTSSSTGKTFKITGHNTCSTENVIYQLQCKQCPAQYIGLTTNSLRTRMNGHRQDVNNQFKDKPVVQHAIAHQCNNFNNCFSTKIVKALPPDCNSSQLRRWEQSYQWFTNSRKPPNLNIR